MDQLFCLIFVVCLWGVQISKNAVLIVISRCVISSVNSFSFEEIKLSMNFVDHGMELHT